MKDVKIEIKNDIMMFNREFLDCKKSSTIHIDEKDLKAYLFDMIELVAPRRYNAIVKHGVEEFKDLTKSMRVDRFCTRFYSYILKLNNEVDGYLDFKYMLWGDIFVNYMSLPDDITILDFLKDYCAENEIVLEDLTGEGTLCEDNSEPVCV